MVDRRPLISGNWKMFKTCDEALEFVQSLKTSVASVSDVDIMIAAPFATLSPVSKAIEGTPICLCAQNIHWEQEGAFTSEISARMLKSAGCRFVIIGHSERHQYFGETDQDINRKIDSAAKAVLIPVFCIGETEAQRDAGETFSVLDKQVKNGLKGLFSENLKYFVVAYEPVWTIGTGKTVTKEQAQEVHSYVRKRFAEMYGSEFAKGLRILYGGSVKPSNVKDLMAMEDIDGILVGGTGSHISLGSKAFKQLFRQVTSYENDLLKEAKRIAKREGLDVVSAIHIIQADRVIKLNRSENMRAGLSSIGGILLGCSLSNIWTYFNAGIMPKWGTLISIFLGFIGTILFCLIFRPK